MTRIGGPGGGLEGSGVSNGSRGGGGGTQSAGGRVGGRDGSPGGMLICTSRWTRKPQGRWWILRWWRWPICRWMLLMRGWWWWIRLYFSIKDH